MRAGPTAKFTTRAGRAHARRHNDDMTELASSNDGSDSPPASRERALHEPEKMNWKLRTCPNCLVSKLEGKGEGTWNGNFRRHANKCAARGAAGASTDSDKSNANLTTKTCPKCGRTFSSSFFPKHACHDGDHDDEPALSPRSPRPKQSLSQPSKSASSLPLLVPRGEHAVPVAETSAQAQAITRTPSLRTAPDSGARDFKVLDAPPGALPAPRRPSGNKS